MLASPVNLEDLPGLARLVARMIFIQKGSQGLRVFTEACEPLQIYHLSSCSYSCPVQGRAQDLVIMNIEKNFAISTEKIIIFHCLFQYLQSGLGSHLGQTSPYRRSSGETLNRYSLWRLSPGLGLGLAKCSQVRQFSWARWARCSQFFGEPGLAGLDPRKIFLVQGSLGSRLARSRARANPDYVCIPYS